MSDQHPAAGHAPRRPMRFVRRHPLALLLAIEAFAIFALTPLIELGLVPPVILPATFSLLLVAAMYAAAGSRTTRRGTLVLGGLLVPLEVWRYLGASAPVLMLHFLGMAVFFVIVSLTLARSVFSSRTIRMDEVLGGVLLYLNLGLTFAFIYALLDHFGPGAFQLPTPAPERPLHASYFLYFSFVTLTTVGYGDTLPVSAAARAGATLEAAGPAGLDRGRPTRPPARRARAPWWRHARCRPGQRLIPALSCGDPATAGCGCDTVARRSPAAPVAFPLEERRAGAPRPAWVTFRNDS
jgi:voltage-gated potassium channel